MTADSAVHTLKTAIETRALELGFDRIGFAPAAPPRRAEFFRQWLAEGKAGTMTYLNRSAGRRADPQLVLEDARTIVSVAQSYFTGRLPQYIRNDPARGLIASYAWGQDYHDVLLTKLKQLASFIQAQVPNSVTGSYVDTGHILERDHGERAGLGFIGKNTMLISPRIGSTFFLGEILTTLELPSALPVHMPSCGSCTRCLDVCPTHALPTAYVLDSTLCISYLTIEYRGIIPRALRAKLGHHIFGCDDCQDCCPWNQRFAQETQEAAYRAQLERQAPRLRDLALLTETAFHERFAGSAVLRPRYGGFLRNVAIALGNCGREEAVESLSHLLAHHDNTVRLHAVWGMGQVEGREAEQRLRRVEAEDDSEDVRQEARDMLAQRAKEKP